MRGSPEGTRMVVLTISDRCARGAGGRFGAGGGGVAETAEWRVVGAERFPRREVIVSAPRYAAKRRLICTTGGTGLAARDVTPEATRRCASGWWRGWRSGCAEGLRETPLAVLSRGVCGVVRQRDGRTLMVNLPGSPAGATIAGGDSGGASACARFIGGRTDIETVVGCDCHSGRWL